MIETKIFNNPRQKKKLLLHFSYLVTFTLSRGDKGHKQTHCGRMLRHDINKFHTVNDTIEHHQTDKLTHERLLKRSHSKKC